jgi:kynurenine formamidase
MPDFEEVLTLTKELSNWGRWGNDDQRGTVNFITPHKVIEGARAVRQGRAFSLALPFNRSGPQTGERRFNPMLFLTLDGGDFESGIYRNLPRYRREVHSQFTDDVWVLPSQGGTQWDALAHCMHNGHMYNGFRAKEVASFGAQKCGIEVWSRDINTRGVLLDIARHKGVAALEPGYAITVADLEGCASAQRIEVREGDIVLVRTGQLGMCRAAGVWGDYAGGDAPGLSLWTTRWIHSNRVAGVATDTWGAEVRPNEIPEAHQPFHIVALVYMGLLLGEIFALDEFAADCASDGQYDFQFVAPPIPVTGAVGSPINPIAIK